MWFITHTISGESVCFLPNKLKYSVGRLGADVELQDDICVSRAHAAFHLVQSDDQYKLELEDLGSKYGTYLNKPNIETNTAVEKTTRIPLKNNDLIRFGRLQNIWKVQYMKLKTATSSLVKEDALQLKKYVDALRGKILEHWSPNCTHLTMQDPAVTMKLLHALVEQKYVVTLNYWRDLLAGVNSVKAILPKPDMYKPDFGDNAIDAGCNIKRRILFKGYTFVFLNRRHYEMYSPIVREASGMCKDLNSGVQKAFLIKDKVVVVQYTPSTQTQSSQTINTIADFLESNSKRIIPEYEIGLAILYCSMEKYCNPSYKMSQSMPLTVPNELLDSSQMNLSSSQTSGIKTESMDLVISETGNMVTSTPYVNLNSSKDGQSMSTMHITETPVENLRKRKVMSVDLNESDDGDLFQFQSKKTCNATNMKSPENLNKSSNINVFLQKSHTKIKTPEVTHNATRDEASISRLPRKRPLIQVLNDDDEGNDEDLFSFGDTQKTKKSRQQNEEGGDDLFSFKEREDTTNAKKPIRTIEVDEDSNDLEATQQFVVVTKKSSVQMPKPKILPRKISAVEWISTSFGKINIKRENSAASIKNENDNENDENAIKTDAEIKTEIGAEISITEDHRKWLESLKGAIEIQQVSLNNTMKNVDKSHYKFKNRSNNAAENVNDTTPNFKRFVKKYHTPQNNSTGIKLHLR